MRNHTLGIVALVFGIVALGLAVIPGIALDRPFPFANQAAKAPPEPAGDADVTIKFKKFSVQFGKRDRDNAGGDLPGHDAPAAIDQHNSTDRDQLLKWFTISAVSFSLIGLIFGPISWAREKQPAVSGSAIGICCLALVWQYVAIGIAVGVAIAVLLIVLSHLGG